MRRRFFAHGASLLLLVASVAIAEPPPRGYQPRACGFDLDDDGIVGEPEDCRICDGLTADPDGDAQDEDLYYVDCDAGVDSATCGAPWAPCATIEHAWGTRADGPGDLAEDIICFRGTCLTVEQFSPPHGGVPGHVVIPATGSQARDWHHPRNPTMLVGWDSDGDHIYPPVDPDDTAILAGGNRTRAFRLAVGTDYLEMAHFTAQGYGRTVTDNDSGFVRWGPGDGEISYQSFHDLELLRINMDRDVESGNSLVNLFTSDSTPRWIRFANLDVVDNGQWFVRGSGEDDKLLVERDMGPFRFTNITRTAHSCDASVCGGGAGSTAFKLWGFLSGVEILDSIWDANVDAWEPNAVGGASGSSFANPSQCTQDWVIRNNTILDYKNVLIVDSATSGFCDTHGFGEQPPRPVDDIVFDANEAWNIFEPWDQGDQGIRIAGVSAAANASLGDVTITNNILASTPGWEAAVWIRAGSTRERPPGIITIAHNTFYGNPNRHGAVVIGNVEGSDPNFPMRRFRIHHNIFDEMVPFEGVSDYAVRTTYTPADLVMDNNAYDPRGRFRWNGTNMGFTVWQTQSGLDTSSARCSPLYEDLAAGDLHLSRDDSCALDHGGAPATGVTLDVDGEPRVFLDDDGLGALDIGADEVGALLFCDGFESGNPERWTTSVP